MCLINRFRNRERTNKHGEKKTNKHVVKEKGMIIDTKRIKKKKLVSIFSKNSRLKKKRKKTWKLVTKRKIISRSEDENSRVQNKCELSCQKIKVEKL